MKAALPKVQSGTMAATAASFCARSPRTPSYFAGSLRNGATTPKPAARKADANQNPEKELAPVSKIRISCGSQGLDRDDPRHRLERAGDLRRDLEATGQLDLDLSAAIEHQ